LLIRPGQEYEIGLGDGIVKMLPKNGLAFGDKSFRDHKLFEQLIENDALFIIRIKFNRKWDKNDCIATKRSSVRVVCFSSIEHKADYFS